MKLIIPMLPHPFSLSSHLVNPGARSPWGPLFHPSLPVAQCNTTPRVIYKTMKDPETKFAVFVRPTAPWFFPPDDSDEYEEDYEDEDEEDEEEYE